MRRNLCLYLEILIFYVCFAIVSSLLLPQPTSYRRSIAKHRSVESDVPCSSSLSNLLKKTLTNLGLSEAASNEEGGVWLDRVAELYQFSLEHGHTRVPKRFKPNLTLGNWVIKQRMQYRSFQSGTKSCSLTQARIDILNAVGFTWDGSQKNSAIVTCEKDGWWTRYRELETLMRASGDDDKPASIHSVVSASSAVGKWLNRQRRIYRTTLSCSRTAIKDVPLNEKQVEALAQLDEIWWMTNRDWVWQQRYEQLIEYKKQYGDCCVPISFENKQLANWVSNQRKQYTLRCQNKPCDLTFERQAKLDAIDFAWNRWEYEFEKQSFSLNA